MARLVVGFLSAGDVVTRLGSMLSAGSDEGVSVTFPSVDHMFEESSLEKCEERG